MGNRRGIFVFTFLIWTLAHARASDAVPEVVPVLVSGCPALTASSGPAAPVIAEDIERQLRIAMAWPETGKLFVVEVPSDDGVPTYEVRRTITGMAAVLRILVPGQSTERLAREGEAMALGARRDLAPKPIDLGLPNVLACRDLPGDAVETRQPAPLQEIAKALRAVHALTADVPEKSLVEEIQAAVQQRQAQLGANAVTLRQALGALELTLIGLQTPKVPCLRSIPTSSVRIDAAGTVRFYGWNHFAKADPFEDYAQMANLVELAPADVKDFLGKLLHRQPTSSDFARLAIYRALSAKVPDPESVTAAKLLALVTLVNSDLWQQWMRDLPQQ